MVWSTKKLARERKYIVVKHSLRGINYNIKGVKYRDGFGVVEKDSKLYFELKKIRPAAIVDEFPIDFLLKLPFITRSRDINLVYGKDIYYYYINKLRAAQTAEAEAEHLESDKCKFHLKAGKYCGNELHKLSPTGHCLMHLFQDPKLEEILGEPVSIPMGKKPKRRYKQQILEKLQQIQEEKELESSSVSVDS